MSTCLMTYVKYFITHRKASSYTFTEQSTQSVARGSFYVCLSPLIDIVSIYKLVLLVQMYSAGAILNISAITGFLKK